MFLPGGVSSWLSQLLKGVLKRFIRVLGLVHNSRIVRDKAHTCVQVLMMHVHVEFRGQPHVLFRRSHSSYFFIFKRSHYPFLADMELNSVDQAGLNTQRPVNLCFRRAEIKDFCA